MEAGWGVATASDQGRETPRAQPAAASTALAHAAGLDPSYVARLLRDVISCPTLPTLRRLADALHAPLAELAVAAGYPVVAAAPPLADAAPPIQPL